MFREMDGIAAGQSATYAAPYRTPARRLARHVAGAPWDLLRIVTCYVLLSYVWRVQDLFLVLISLKAALISSLAAIALFTISPASLRALVRTRHPVMKLAIVILVLMVLSIPASVWPGNSFRFIVDDHLKTIIMMLLVVTSVRAYADVERYAAAHVLGGAIYSAFVIFKLQVGSDGRLGSLFYYDANDLGMLLVCTIPFVLYFSRRSAPIAVRLLALLAGALYVVAIVRTGSRGAFLGLIAVAIFALLAFAAVPVGSRIGWVVGGFLALNLIASDKYWGMMQTLLNPQSDYNWSGRSDSGRMETWKRGIGYMMGRPLTGVGVMGFATAEGTISPLAARQATGKGVKWSAPHNIFVQLGAELGVPGLLAFVALLVAAFRTMGAPAKHRLHDDPGRRAEAAMAQALRICIVAYVVTGFFLSQGYAAFLYALLGLIVAHSAVARAREGETVPRWSAWWTPAGQPRVAA